MMSNGYSLPPRKGRICRIAGAIFITLAALNVVGGASWLAGPAPHVYCDDTGCRWKPEPLTLLDEEDRAIVAASPANQKRFADYVAMPSTRTGLAATGLLALPFTLMILGIGVALLRLGGRSGDPLGTALPWLRRASIAAILWAVLRPLHESLIATILAPGLPGDEYYFYFTADWGKAGNALLLAIAGYATVWALEAGVRAQRDLDEFV